MSHALPDRWPADWPSPGDINLAEQDLPHASATTEWWYQNCHLTTLSGRKLSLFSSFFRIVVGIDEVTKQRVHAHSITWAIADVDGKVLHTVSKVDQDAPRLGLEKLDRGEGTHDKRLRRAMREVLEKGQVPWPDRLFEDPIFVSERRLELDFAGDTLTRTDAGAYQLQLSDGITGGAANILITPQKKACRHGDNGVVKAVQGEDMFYYFIPRCSVTGTIRIAGVDEVLAEGSSAWVDHEFGHHGAVSEPTARPEDGEVAGKDPKKVDIAWNWISVQFTDNTEMTAYALHDLVSKESAGDWAVCIDADGDWRGRTDAVFTPSGTWRSTRTFNEYPNHWHVSLPSEGLELEAIPAFEDQEFITLISKPAFWEGRVHVTGTRHGEPVSGTGYIERSGFATISDLDSFFKSVGKATRASVRALLPYEPDRNLIQNLVADADRPDWIQGVDTEQFVDTMIRPIRAITDRGGKSWRSYAALACCDVVGGDSREFAQWLAMPELMHTGSLIVDDVQDRSDVRRGGPTCHLEYGDAIAINAGTACYFLGQKLLMSENVSAQNRLRLYDFYFAALRAGHSGQALDIGGIDDLMPAAVASGDAQAVEERVLAVHRLKTAIPAASLARMGALVGEGSEAQVDGVGRFFEAVGLAFQIIDDVLNLRGFKGDLKSRGEDLAMGKVTLPVARALPRMNLAEREWLWRELQAKHEDPEMLGQMIDRIEDCGALTDCEREARQLVDDAWQNLDKLTEPSLPKLMLRAFSWYVLERHY